LVEERRVAGGGHTEGDICVDRARETLGFDGDVRRMAFARCPGSVDGGDLVRAERAIVVGNLVEEAVELAVPEGRAGTAEEQREAAEILGEGDVRLRLQLP